MRYTLTGIGGSNPPASDMNWIYQYQFFILLGLFFAGFGVLSWYTRDIWLKMRKLFGGKTRPSENIQSELIRRLTELEIDLEEIKPRLAMLEAIAKMSIQKVGFMRFNPFQDTGGDNSFVIAFLDHENNGVLLSSLYTREGVRVYAKEVQMGRTRHLLSGEEKKVLEETVDKAPNPKSQAPNKFQ